MKSKITPFVLIVLILSYSHAQNPGFPVQGSGINTAEPKTQCLTDEQRLNIKQELKVNTKTLEFKNKLAYSKTAKRGGHPLFIWPIQKAENVTFNDVWAISGYFDHNENYPNQLTDYNCGTITYDTNSGYNHQGVDIYNWPFTWKLMDDNSVEIIAAADGQIIAKNDGEFDRSCDFNNNLWNAIYVQHNDGSIAWYGHMKNGSLSTKNVGDLVSQGEYLGVVGSSGNSTGPHLHFEVYTDSSFSQLVDPFSGTCNGMNTESWWADQKPYSNPNINAVMAHSQAPDIFPTCPTTETTYESANFDISDLIFVSAYLRDQITGTPLALKIIRPNGSYLFDWSIETTATSSSWYYYWSFYADAIGTWTWEVTYEGQTETYEITVTDQLGLNDDTLVDTSIYPNPFNSVVNIRSNAKIKKASIVDILGKTVLIVNKKSDEGINTLNLTQFSKGIYFVTLEGDDNQKKTVKLIKN